MDMDDRDGIWTDNTANSFNPPQQNDHELQYTSLWMETPTRHQPMVSNDYTTYEPQPFTPQQFLPFDPQNTFPTPPSNMQYPPALMPPPPLPFKVQQPQRTRSPGRESCKSPFDRPGPSMLATPTSNPNYSPSPDDGRSNQCRQYPSPRSSDGHPTHQSPEEFQFAVRSDSSGSLEGQEFMFKDWMDINYTPSVLSDSDTDRTMSPASDTSVSTTREGRQSYMGELLDWGSDSNFGPVKQHYTPGPLNETVDSMHLFQLLTLKCLQVSDDKPRDWRQEQGGPLKLRTSSTSSHAPDMSSSSGKHIQVIGDHNGHARNEKIRGKRRKRNSSLKHVTESEPGDEAEDMVEEDATPRRNSKPRGMSARRRRKESKTWQTRPVLTDEQRRQNHIKSEKKRRILINEGFDDLCALVPSLGKGKFCKSTVLQLAGQWLDELLEGNKALSAQLSEIGR